MNNKKPFARIAGAGLMVFLFIFLYNPVLAHADWDWDVINDLRSYHIRDLTCNDSGLYVAVGDDGIVKASTDLTNWTAQNSATNEYLFGCTWGNGRFVAVGRSGTIISSKDGSTWVPCQVRPEIDFEDVTWGNGKYVALGCVYPLTGKADHQFVFTSIDGINWVQEWDYTGQFAWRNIEYLNGAFIIYGLKSGYAVSVDGSKWECFDDANSATLNDVIWDGKQYIGVGSDSLLCTSPNAIDWTIIGSHNLNKDLFLGDIAVFKGKYYVTASKYGENVFLCSKDLEKWALTGDRVYNEISALISNDKLLIGAGWDQTILSTTDGIRWSVKNEYSPNLSKVIWDGSRFVAIGVDGSVLFSQDASKWTKFKTKMIPPVVDMVWTGKQYVALAVTYDDAGYNIDHSDTYTSEDGKSWSHLSTIKIKDIDKLFYVNNQYFALGRNGQILVSSDAMKWRTTTTGTDKWLNGLAWNGSRYICVGMYGTMLTSNDGFTWTQQKPLIGDDFQCILWNGSEFLAVGNFNRIVRSEDGLNWQFVNSEYREYKIIDVLWDGNRFILLQNLGEISILNDLPIKVSNRAISGPRSLAWNGERYVIVGTSSTLCTFIPQDIIKVKIMNVPIPLEVAPRIINGRAMVPARAILEKLGAELKWDNMTDTITVTNGQTEILLTIGSDMALVNGEAVALDSPAIIVGNRTLVPLRFLAENLGSVVSWDANSNTVSIN